MYNWFPRDCQEYDKRTPGLFKVEFEGYAIVARCSKIYYCSISEGEDKLSCKGAQNPRLNFTLDTFRQVLQTKRSAMCTNRGFRAENPKIYTYFHDRAAFLSKTDHPIRRHLHNVFNYVNISSDYHYRKRSHTRHQCLRGVRVIQRLVLILNPRLEINAASEAL